MTMATLPFSSSYPIPSPSLLGALTTTFTPPNNCPIPIIEQATTSPLNAWQAQNCYRGATAADETTCWPSASVPISQLLVHGHKLELYGFGYYSPGLVCPVGYTSVCSATAAATSNFPFQFPPTGMETAVGCCPTGYVCSYVVNAPTHQTCITTATSATFQGAFCENASSSFGMVTIPGITMGNWTFPSTLSTLSIYAPMIQLVFQSSDVQAMSTPSVDLVSVSRISNEGVSKGTIIGIVVGCIAGLVVVIVGILLALKARKPSQRLNQESKDVSLGKPELSGESVQTNDVVELAGTNLVELEGTGHLVELQGTDRLVELQAVSLIIKKT